MPADIPPSWFVEALSRFAGEIYRNTGVNRPIEAIVLAEDLGYRLGVSPLGPLEVHTAGGYVTVRSIMKPLFIAPEVVPEEVWQARDSMRAWATATSPLGLSPEMLAGPRVSDIEPRRECLHNQCCCDCSTCRAVVDRDKLPPCDCAACSYGRSRGFHR